MPQETRARSEGKTFAASAKKKGKRKKKGDVTEDPDTVLPSRLMCSAGMTDIQLGWIEVS